jgi:hypothetical protein
MRGRRTVRASLGLAGQRSSVSNAIFAAAGASSTDSGALAARRSHQDPINSMPTTSHRTIRCPFLRSPNGREVTSYDRVCNADA